MVTNFESDYVDATADSVGLGLKARLMAAGWFAGAASIPVLLFVAYVWAISGNRGTSGRFNAALWFVWLFAVVPISSAALLGFTFGCRIVDPCYHTTSGRAALRGMAVASFSFVLMTISCGMLAWASSGLPWNDSLVRAAEIMFVVFVFGFFIIGWLVVIVGALAGWLLYRVSSKDPARFLDLPGESGVTAKVWIAIAILLFLMNYAGVLLLVSPGEY